MAVARTQNKIARRPSIDGPCRQSATHSSFGRCVSKRPNAWRSPRSAARVNPSRRRCRSIVLCDGPRPPLAAAMIRAICAHVR